MQVVANRPHHDFAGVEAHARLHLQAVGAAHLLGIAAQRGLHGEGRITGPHGVILMRQRRAEQRHDAIAHDLVHGALRSGVRPPSSVPAPGSRSWRASSGSRSARSSIEPLRSANSTVTCLRSPSSALREVRIFSAR